MKKTPILFAIVLLAASPLMAATPVESRQQAFKKILLSFEPMGVMLRGYQPYKKDSFIHYADTLQQIAAEPFIHFPANSISGNSRAKTEIWSQPTKFQQAKEHFLQSVTELSHTAHSADLAAVKQSYARVAQSCKACHDGFRGPKK
ncbi:cytochrome c [Neisseriaceae bacterium TC5R-5]|nr:cytochrome c [Neisseriaceae bacterium TC5R-5]